MARKLRTTAALRSLLRAAARADILPERAALAAGAGLARIPTGDPGRPKALLAAARIYQRVGDWRGVAECLTELFARRRDWPPPAAAAEAAAVNLLVEALWRLRRHREVIPWADRAAVLALVAGRYPEAFAGLRTALHASFLVGDPGAAGYLKRMAGLLPHLGGQDSQAAAELKADQAWERLIAGQYPEAVALARTAWESPAGGLQVQAQSLWVVAEAAWRLGARAVAAPLHAAAQDLAIRAEWDLGLRLCADLAARLAGR